MTKIQGQGFMQMHAGDTQSFAIPQPTPTPSTKPSPPSTPYPMPNNTRLSGTAALSASGFDGGGLSGSSPTLTESRPANQTTSDGNFVAPPSPASWSSSVSASMASASGWATNPACTASWLSRLAASNGTVVTTQSWRYTAALSVTSTTTFGLNEIATGPTTTVFTPGAITYTIGHDDVCCGQCHIRYPLVRVYYWPVNSTNTWCLSLNPPSIGFTDSATTSSVLFSGPSSNTLGLPTLTSNTDTMPTDLPKLHTSPSNTDTMPTDLPKLPALSSSPNAAAAASGLPTLSHSLLNTATEIESTNLPKLPSSSSSLNAATESGPSSMPKLTPRDMSHITPAPSLPSLSAELLHARAFVPLNHSKVYAAGPDGFILYV